MGKSETQIQNAIRLELSKVGIVRRNNVGTFLSANGYPIKCGIPGESDLTLFQHGGTTVFIEVKTPTGRQSKKQKNFQKAVENMGYKYIIMKSVEDARQYAEAVKNERKRIHHSIP